jgi:hypothetical protein
VSYDMFPRHKPEKPLKYRISAPCQLILATRKTGSSSFVSSIDMELAS